MALLFNVGQQNSTNYIRDVELLTQGTLTFM